MNQITFKVTPEMKRKLKKLADSEGLSIADIVRLSLRDKLNKSVFFGNKRGVNNRNYSKEAK